MSGVDMRVNARFDGEYAKQMEFLTEATGLGVSEVLKASVAHYYQMVSASSPSQLPNLRRFIGGRGSGRTDISSRTRELVGDGLAVKHSIKRSGRSGK
jgi:hypothetical protein